MTDNKHDSPKKVTTVRVSAIFTDKLAKIRRAISQSRNKDISNQELLIEAVDNWLSLHPEIAKKI